jgi:hypothetical protein
MSVLGLLPALIAWALVFACGAGMARAFGLERRGPEGAGLALLIGAAILAGLVALLSIPGWVTAPALVVLLLALGGLGFTRGRKRARIDEPAPLGDWLAFLPALLVALLAFTQAVTRPVWHVDAQRRWVLHAQWTDEYHTAVPEAVRDATWGTNHPSYPPLITGVGALALELGADRDWGLRPAFPVFLVALLAVVFGFARRRAGPHFAAAITLGLALVPALSFAEENGLGAAAAHADVALAAYLTALAALLLDRLESERGTPLLALAALTLGAAWTKNEGMAFTLAMLLPTALVLFAAKRRTAARDSALLFGCALGGTLLWKWVARDMPIATGEDYVSGGIVATLASGFERLPEILGRLGSELVDLGAWGPVWLLLPAWLVMVLATRTRRLVVWLPLLWLAVGFALVIAAYMVTGWKDGRFLLLMDVSLARLLLHHVPLVALLLVLLIPDAERSGAAHVEG